MRARLTSACFVALAGASCTVLFDRDRFDDGSHAPGGAGGASTTTASSTSTASSSASTGSPASSSSSGLTGTCVPHLFHEGFDGALGPVLAPDGSDAASIVTTPVRWGTGAYRIALTDADQYTLLRYHDIEYDEEYWMGWSTLHEGPELTDGTRLFSIECVTSTSPDPYMEAYLFSLQMNPATPNLPYYAAGVIDDLLDDAQGGGVPGFDDLDTIVDDGAFSDWVVHLVLSETDDGLLELYRNGAQVYSASGITAPQACTNNFHIEWTLYRWQAMPPPQSLVLDEITLIRGPNSPLTSADVLYTLTPEADCFAN